MKFKLGLLFPLSTFIFIPHVFASNIGTDTNLRFHAASGGMAGASYTYALEPSAAVAGNPATLRQFNAKQFNFGASLLPISELKNVQTTEISTLDATFTNESISSAENYLLPTFGGVLSKTEKWSWGVGLEVDAGIGADFRDDPITLMGGAGEALGLGSPVSLPLLVELISLNANIAAAYQVSPTLIIGSSITVGFATMQLGTVGDTAGLTALNTAIEAVTGADFNLSDFGGTTSSVHDTGVAASVGMVWQVQDDIALSATYKSKMNYQFTDVVSFNSGGFQTLNIDQPAELISGIAVTDWGEEGSVFALDLVYKQWSESDTYQDVYDDQLLISMGVQFADILTKGLSLRLGYSYADSPLLETPNNGLNDLQGVGSIPLGATADESGLGGLTLDVVSIVQMTLVPVIWDHSFTAGLGYELIDGVALNTFVSYSKGNKESRNLTTVDGLLSQFGLATSTQNSVELDDEVVVGLGVGMTF